MTTKRSSLFAALKAIETASVPAANDAAASVAAPNPASVAEPSRRYPVASTRQGKRVTGVYLSDEALAQLKIIAARERKTLQALMQEAVNGLFEGRGLSRIA